MTGTLVLFPLVRADALPEKWKYQDTGCHLFAACLTCPRATCIFDEQDEEPLSREEELARRWRERGEKINSLTGRGFSIQEVADYLGVSTRTVYRTMERVDRDWRASIWRPQFRKSAFK